MLNEKKERELAYTVKIDAIEPIVGSDNCEAAVVGGWKIMVRKGTFKPGDIAIYFEIDSKLPEEEPFMFLASKHFKVKTQKYTFGGKGNFISQGLLMHFNDFQDEWGRVPAWMGAYNVQLASTGEFETLFLTKALKVTYSVAEDNKRKSNITKYDKMYQRHIKLFKKYKILRRIYKYKLGKKFLFIFLGRKKDSFTWPSWVFKTDEERCQNLPQYFPGNEEEWIVTEKIDGSSTTFTMKRHSCNKFDFYVCSRNVCFDKPEKADKCYYDTNIYLEMAEKYHIEDVLKEILKKEKDLEFITIQGETFGDGIQKRTYGLENKEHDFRAFNLIFGYKDKQERKDSRYARMYLAQYGIPFVPILDIAYKIPETCEQLLEYAGSGPSKIDGGMREGIVLRDKDGIKSFKAVDNSFLLKYHQ